ncbi:fluoroquinolone export ABC transporter permease subunit, partial [Amphibacillus sediminis]|uniref:fluoroquinolone export ABC transporter permease subunit n=1 Tax=Amphibacillus sediminis TaxID=360185 RepID=UPI0008311443
MIVSLLKQDIRFQFRHGFYYAYLLVTVIYIVLLLALPESIQSYLTTLIIFSDPATLGFFFIGAILLLERHQQLLTYLFVTPVRLIPFLLAKLLSLFLISVLTSIIIVMVVMGLAVSYWQLALALLLTSVFFTMCGIFIAVRTQSLNAFLVRAILVMIVLYLPLVSYFELWSHPLMQIFPVYSSLFLLRGAIQGGLNLSDTPFWLHTGMLMIWNAILFYLTYQRFKRSIIASQGD